MRFGRVLTYKDVAEAEKLEGKKVVASMNLFLIENEGFCLAYAKHYKVTLAGARKGLQPFAISNGYKLQFIREVIEDEPEGPHYEPYDLSDKEVRDSLRGRWFRDEYGNVALVNLFDYHERRTVNVWSVNGYSPRAFLEKCEWLDDGTPCGQLVHAGEGHVEGNASERRVDG